MSRHSVLEREADTVSESPFGSVGVLHDGRDLKAWWIWKDEEEIDPEFKLNSREDFLLVLRGALKLELRGAGEQVLEAGDAFVIPAGVPFRGYRWPRGSGEPCLFLAVSPSDQEMTSESAE